MSEDDALALFGITSILSAAVILPWSMCSTGGLYELKQMNPKHQHENKNLTLLTAVAQEGPWYEATFWPILEKCASFMPDWDDAGLCFTSYVDCEEKHYGYEEWKRDTINGVEIAPGATEEYHRCISAGVPTCGPLCQLRSFRAFARKGTAKMLSGDTPDKDESPALWRWMTRGI